MKSVTQTITVYLLLGASLVDIWKFNADLRWKPQVFFSTSEDTCFLSSVQRTPIECTDTIVETFLH
jgi:hypothetical protein